MNTLLFQIIIWTLAQTVFHNFSLAQDSLSYFENDTSKVTFIAFGDVNLGRKVGQRILAGDIEYPFKKMSFQNDSSTIIFVNLESQLSDQKGETQHPKNNLIFTGPPEGAVALQKAGITIVSTANNHAFDYGFGALKETMQHLYQNKIHFIGTDSIKENLYRPLIYVKNNIKFAIFAVTDLMNFPTGWQDYICFADTGRLFPMIREVRPTVDVLILSYHGGAEYLEKPILEVNNFAQRAVDNGVDLFIGHHPHVTHGIQKKGKSFIATSLGNFVFYQPQRFWTQRSYGVQFNIQKTMNGTTIDFERIIPIYASFQPRRVQNKVIADSIRWKAQSLSTIRIQ